jgi:peptide-methionine (S)-S-oxide reductase
MIVAQATNRPPGESFIMTTRHLLLSLLLPIFALACCGPVADPVTNPNKATIPIKQPDSGNQPPANEQPNANTMTETPETPTATSKHEVATLGNGCFWCTEAVLEQLNGVLDVESGYSGGIIDNPTYKQICSGTTEHAEVVKVTFDPAVISYESLLDWFFRSHDPTTLNRQGNDVGTQYRSVIFFHSEQQQQTALALMEKIANNWEDPIVTEVVPIVKFWPAEAYHQDYFRNNQNQGYCRIVIKTKLSKLGLDDAPKK